MSGKRSREWVKLHTSVLSDDLVLDLTPSAKAAYLLGLARAGVDAADGRIPCVPRSVARWTGLTLDEATAAVKELADAGLWICQGEEAQIRNWGSYQPTQAEIDSKRQAAQERLARYREKKRTERDTAKAESGELDAAAVRSRLWAAMSRAVKDEMDQETAVAIYRKLYTDAVAAGEENGRYAAVKGVGPAMLANLVVNHAAMRWLGIEPDDPALRRLHALRKDHGAAVLDVMPTAAAAAKGDPIAYMTGILRKGGTR